VRRTRAGLNGFSKRESRPFSDCIIRPNDAQSAACLRAEIVPPNLGLGAGWEIGATWRGRHEGPRRHAYCSKRSGFCRRFATQKDERLPPNSSQWCKVKLAGRSAFTAGYQANGQRGIVWHYKRKDLPKREDQKPHNHHNERGSPKIFVLDFRV
jgi:hypothetical protein